MFSLLSLLLVLLVVLFNWIRLNSDRSSWARETILFCLFSDYRSPPLPIDDHGNHKGERVDAILVGWVGEWASN